MSDTPDLSASIPGYIALALFIAKELYTFLNHQRIRSVCCNRMCISSLDIEQTTPPPTKGPNVTAVV